MTEEGKIRGIKGFLAATILIIISGCQNPISPETSVELVHPGFFTLEAGIFAPYVESSLIMNNGKEWAYFDNGERDFLLSIDKGQVKKIGMNSLFQNVTWIGSSLYCTYLSTDGNAYVKTSTDGLNWSDGKLILSRQNGTIFNTIWNVAIALDDKGNWMAAAECSDAGNEIASTVILRNTVLDFDSVKNQITKIPLSGNPWIAFVKNRGWLVLLGDQASGIWTTTAYVMPTGTSVWMKTGFAVGQPGIHVCDPYLSENTHNGLSLLVSYDQKEIVRLDANMSMVQFFDTIYPGHGF